MSWEYIYILLGAHFYWEYLGTCLWEYHGIFSDVNHDTIGTCDIMGHN